MTHSMSLKKIKAWEILATGVAGMRPSGFRVRFLGEDLNTCDISCSRDEADSIGKALIGSVKSRTKMQSPSLFHG